MQKAQNDKFPQIQPQKNSTQNPHKTKTPSPTLKNKNFQATPKTKFHSNPRKTPKKPTLSLRASHKASVAIHKFKAYLKFFGFFATLKMTNSPKFRPPKPQNQPKNPKQPPKIQNPQNPKTNFKSPYKLSQKIYDIVLINERNFVEIHFKRIYNGRRNAYCNKCRRTSRCRGKHKQF